jgi:cysteine desulfurase/selenocysteine lyase
MPTESHAIELSTAIGNAELFPSLSHWSFFNHAGVSPLPRASADAIRAYADDAEINAYLGGTWFKEIEQLRKSTATLINATVEEIALVKNTAEGISLVAAGIDWKPGDRIVTTAVEYPTNIYPWMEVAQRRGAELVMVPQEIDATGAQTVPLDKILAEAAHPRTRLVTLSHVEFASGQRHDLATIGAFCRPRGKLLCVDAIQSLGALPVDVMAMNIDYLTAGGHKWMLGPVGTGIFYCRKALLDATRPLAIGAMSVVDAHNFGNYDYTLRPDAARYEAGAPPVAGLLGLKQSIELLLAVGIDNVATRLKTLTDRLISGLQPRGYAVVSPRTGDAWSGIVIFNSPVHNREELAKSLKRDHKIELALRGDGVRFSAHFYNTEAQIDALLNALPAHP